MADQLQDIDSIKKILLMRAMAEENQVPTEAVAVPGAVAGSVLGTLIGTPSHMLGQHRLNQLDNTNPVTKTVNDVTGQVYRRDMPGQRVKPGARMAGALVGSLVGGGLGAGTAELIKRESPSARLLAKIQTQNGRLTPSDESALEAILSNTYSNMSMLGG